MDDNVVVKKKTKCHLIGLICLVAAPLFYFIINKLRYAFDLIVIGKSDTYSCETMCQVSSVLQYVVPILFTVIGIILIIMYFVKKK